jgi:hypothetical protein
VSMIYVSDDKIKKSTTESDKIADGPALHWRRYFDQE